MSMACGRVAWRVAAGWLVALAAMADGQDARPRPGTGGERSPRGETDLQVVCISRTPKYPRYAPEYTYYEVTEPSGFGPYVFSAATGLGLGQDAGTQRWPKVGDVVTYTATVRNRGTEAWNGAVRGVWTVDGVQKGHPAVNGPLAPGGVVTLTLKQTWDFESHAIAFTLDGPDARKANDTLTIDAKGVEFLSFIDEGYVAAFAESSKGYPGAVTDDIIDWLNFNMARFNRMFEGAGVEKRVQFGRLEVIPDGAPDPEVETILYAVFPFRFRAGDGSMRLSGYYDPAEDVDFGYLHECGHQLGLIDLYRLDMGPDQNFVSKTGYSAAPCLMLGCSHFLSVNSALAMQHWEDTAHGYFGQYLYGMPEHVAVRLTGAGGKPLAGARVTVYQKCERPGMGEVVTDQAKATGKADGSGVYTLPNVAIDPGMVPPLPNGDVLGANPFGYLAVVGTNGLLLLKVELNGFTDYCWLDVTEVNDAFRQGQTGTAVFDRALSLGGDLEVNPPRDMAELNAASWGDWAQTGENVLSDDEVNRVVGQGSVKMVTTGGFDTLERYPGDHLARWDLTNAQTVRFWAYAENQHTFQERSPWVRLSSPNGSLDLKPNEDLLNAAIGQWVEFVVPLAGDGTWTRYENGAVSLAQVTSVEIHSDTWDYGFSLWLDGVRFDPQPCAGDVDGNGLLDLFDFLEFSNEFNAGSERADCDWSTGRGVLDLFDFLCYVNQFGAGCP
jgi:hypothetical protein